MAKEQPVQNERILTDRERIELLEFENKKLKKENEQLKEFVTVDELTELKNRRGFLREVGKVFLQVVSQKKADKPREHVKIDDLSIVFIDVDNFKLINDTAGHDEGDAVLQQVSEKLRKVFRASDHFGRWGGEEFLVGMVGANEQAAITKAEKLRSALAEIVIPDYPELKISASIGVASARGSEASSLNQLINFADKAMYEAKLVRGKDNVVFHSDIS